MKDKIIKKLEYLKEQKKKHEINLAQLTSAREKCIATINATIGGIETAEDLLREGNKDA